MSRSKRSSCDMVKGLVLVLLIFLVRDAFGARVEGTFSAKDGQSEVHERWHESTRFPRIELFPLFSFGSLFSGNYTSALVWPNLELNWRVVLGSIIGFLGASFGSVGGVGGGGIFVPTLTLVIGFDQKSSAALSKCMIMGASAATVWFNFKLKHPTRNAPIIDYHLALLFQPMLMLGISIGVICNVIFPNWLVTILLIILFTVTSIKAFSKAVATWRKETIQKNQAEMEKSAKLPCEGLDNGEYEPLQDIEIEQSESVCFKTHWKGIAYLVFVWISFLILQVLKNNATTCSILYWLWNSLQIPVALFVFLKEAASLYSRSKALELGEQHDFICSADVKWTLSQLILSGVAGLSAGIVGGLLGLGGGFILGPLLLELSVPPQVSSATATFVMLFSSSMSVVEYHLLHRFPVPFALYLIALSVAAGFWGQYVVKKLVMLLGRASVIIFMLAVVILISALTLGGFGIQESITRLERREYMGFLSLCKANS